MHEELPTAVGNDIEAEARIKSADSSNLRGKIKIIY